MLSRLTLALVFLLSVPNTIGAEQKSDDGNSKIAIQVYTQDITEPGAMVVSYRFGTTTLGMGLKVDTSYFEDDEGGDWSGGWALIPALMIELASVGNVTLTSHLEVGAGLISSEMISSTARFTMFGGLGINYWLSPQFAIGARSGVRGDFITYDAPIYSVASDSGLQILALF